MKYVIAYIPVIHAGYEVFFQKHRADELYVLGKSITTQFPRLERDIRALDPKKIRQTAKLYKYAEQAYVLEVNSMWNITPHTEDEVVMPDEEISHWFAERYLSGCQITFDSTFLRWDLPASLTKRPIEADRTISACELDRVFMLKATQEAAKSSDWWRQIGAVVVRDGKILFQAHNKHYPNERTPYILGDPRSNFDAGDPRSANLYSAVHAEGGIIAEAARSVLEGADIYVESFPCPPCAHLLVIARVRRVFYSKGYSSLEADKLFKQAGIEMVHVPLEPQP